MLQDVATNTAGSQNGNKLRRPGPGKATAAVVERADGEEVSESTSKNVFSPYVCRSVSRGQPHPGDIAEAASLSAVPLPATSYPIWDSIPADVIDSGKLSQLQLEGILYACTKHQQILPSGERAGFFIGDGAGVGKGRQISGAIIDNFARGRRKHVWLSISTDLHLDAQRDFRDLGCHINVINNCQTLDRETKALGLSQDCKEGVLFMTYSTLISHIKGKSRLQQVIDWLGGTSFDGCLVFDECHKAKNFAPGKEAMSTKVATCVIELQQRLPMARVLYCSATGVSEVGNMAYMTRMGLWGPTTAFPNFEAFLDSMRKRGVSFMEMLAMEMKAEGKYVARGLSFKDASFQELPVPLSARDEDMYNAAVDVWQALRAKLESALVLSSASGKEVWRMFWSAQQRFFKLLCVSLKVPAVVAEAKEALSNDQCVVIGLQSTGEAAADAVGLEQGVVGAFISPTRQLLLNFVEQHFPTRKQPSELPTGPGTAEAAAAAAAAAEEVSECLDMKQQLLYMIDQLQLPANFLDQLVDELGGSTQVAEMTGRKGRIVRDSRGRLVHELRAKPDSSEMDSLNVREKEMFMSGKRLVAIISDAASTGISLHASRQVANQRRRVHLTIELPWSADKAIQQLGRSHRSNQVSGPMYKLVSTSVGGERRFAAAVARRLQSLGALTRGDRRAASGVDLSEQNYDSPLGRKSLRRMYDHIVTESTQLPQGVQLADIYKDRGEDAAQLYTFEDEAMRTAHIVQLHAQLRQHCDTMGIGLQAARHDTVTEDRAPIKGESRDLGDVRRFLNRILGVHVDQQNLLFNYFDAALAAEIRAAKAEGKYSEGLADLFGSSVQSLGRSLVWQDPLSGLQTYLNVFSIDRGLSFEAACKRLELEALPGDASSFRRSRRPMFGHHLVLLALQKPGQKNVFSISRPNTGDSFFDMERDELELRYTAISPKAVQQEWEHSYVRSLDSCMHGSECTQKATCTAGKRLTQVTVLSGSVVRVWAVLEAVLEKYEASLAKSDRTMRVVRVELGNESHLVGVRYPEHLILDVKLTLQMMQQNAPTLAAQGGYQYHKLLQQQEAIASTLGKKGATAGPRVEPPTPIDKKSLAKAFRAPKTMLDFFAAKPRLAGAAAAAPAAAAPVKVSNKATDKQCSTSTPKPDKPAAAHVAAPDADMEMVELLEEECVAGPADQQLLQSSCRALVAGISSAAAAAVSASEAAAAATAIATATSTVAAAATAAGTACNTSRSGASASCSRPAGSEQADGLPHPKRLRASPPQPSPPPLLEAILPASRQQVQDQPTQPPTATTQPHIASAPTHASTPSTTVIPHQQHHSNHATAQPRNGQAAGAAPPSSNGVAMPGPPAGGVGHGIFSAGNSATHSGLAAAGPAVAAAAVARGAAASAAHAHMYSGAKMQRAREVALKELLAMGFNSKDAERAVWMANGNLDRAVELCLTNM